MEEVGRGTQSKLTSATIVLGEVAGGAGVAGGGDGTLHLSLLDRLRFSEVLSQDRSEFLE